MRRLNARRRAPYSLESWDGEPIAKGVSEVCDQEPEAGRKADHVLVYVARECRPQSRTIVPDVVGEDLEDAQDLLRGEGIAFEVVGFRGEPSEKAFRRRYGVVAREAL